MLVYISISGSICRLSEENLLISKFFLKLHVSNTVAPNKCPCALLSLQKIMILKNVRIIFRMFTMVSQSPSPPTACDRYLISVINWNDYTHIIKQIEGDTNIPWNYEQICLCSVSVEQEGRKGKGYWKQLKKKGVWLIQHWWVKLNRQALSVELPLSFETCRYFSVSTLLKLSAWFLCKRASSSHFKHWGTPRVRIGYKIPVNKCFFCRFIWHQNTYPSCNFYSQFSLTEQADLWPLH